MNEEPLSVIRDGGPRYAETKGGRIIVEPWNAVSSLLFLIPAFYCFNLVKGRYKEYIIITLAVPLLILGGIGSTIYHAFRSSSFFLVMDVLPIQMLTMLIIGYFWFKIVPHKVLLVFVIASFIAFKVISYQFFPHIVTANISYFSNGVMMFLPVVLYLPRSKYFQVRILALSILFFALSLIFRRVDMDSIAVMPMGTHWLWHLFSAAGSGFLGYYIFKTQKITHA